ncbi:DUF2283 domain-containing protein [Dehalococcoidia bacterium]|nr:DUF2283 domain-containing protein [Dehalococcoidia bacterium]
MRFTYDPRYNIAYIRFHEKGTEVETIRISDEFVVDMPPDGTIYGIELLSSNEQLQHAAIPLRSIAAGEFNRYTFREGIC